MRSAHAILSDLIDCVHNDGDVARDSTGAPILDDEQLAELLAWQDEHDA